MRYENKVFDLSYDFDKEMIRQIVSERCREYDTEAKDAVLTRVNGVFSVTPGQSGRVVDEEASLNQIYDYMMNEWDFSDASVDMVVKIRGAAGLGGRTVSGKGCSRNIYNELQYIRFFQECQCIERVQPDCRNHFISGR